MSNTENNTMNFNHKYLKVHSLNKRLYGVSLKNKEDNNRPWIDFLNETLDFSKEYDCWVVNNKEVNNFIKLVENVGHDYTSEESSSDSSSDESSTDDELIQKTLTRRLTVSKSKQGIIDEDNVSDSELEDVVSLTRRLRYLLKINNNLLNRVEHLEKKIFGGSQSSFQECREEYKDLTENPE